MNINICYELLKKYQTPLKVVAHSEKVMEIAVNLANIYNNAGGSLDVEKVRFGALLHDIAKAHPKHAILGKEWITSEGYPELGDIISNHMKIADNLLETISEAALVYLSDKQVKGRRRVTIKEKFTSKIENLHAKGNADGARGAEGKYNAAKEIQKQFIADTSVALIVAAGMSSRMGDFKPTLSLGEDSIAQRIVKNFRQAGVRDVVVVVGNQGSLLRENLGGLGIEFVENPDYKTSDMFHSVKLGLSYIQRKTASQIFFTPMDIPLFNPETVGTLGSFGGQICLPTYNGRGGHPVLINAAHTSNILDYKGDLGLKGALDRLGVRDEVEVEDEGILININTKTDYLEAVKRLKKT